MSYGLERLHLTHICPLCRLCRGRVCLIVKCGIGEQFAIDLCIQKPWLSKRNKEIYKIFMAHRNNSIETRHFIIVIKERMKEIFQYFRLLKKQSHDEYKFLLQYYSVLDEFYSDLLDELNLISSQYLKPQMRNISRIDIPKQPKLVDPYLLPIRPTDWNVNNIENKLKWDFTLLRDDNTIHEHDALLEEGEDDEYHVKYQSLILSNRKAIIEPLKDCDIFSFNPKKRKLSVSTSIDSSSESDEDDLNESLSKESKITDIGNEFEMDLYHNDG
ncbi:predicted protein [Naegleria gruberi]|uniref:Predicted protein n=1 Tax=Naegleria gruberi TaxID=5762 RepID=D2V7B9_NAEGR|nr:uncharacterized protein NAEGRDRAFT_64741 [Naegleria gruberi]EFC47349.1 predicted protein [Naegleria gruberi]|eukprot:XP_002680093.1 predicted protein [Naegleria gruberi strain NEG-M]